MTLFGSDLLPLNHSRLPRSIEVMKCPKAWPSLPLNSPKVSVLTLCFQVPGLQVCPLLSTTSKGNFIRVFSWRMGPQTTWRMSAPAKMSTLTVSPCSGNSGEKRINQTLEINRCLDNGPNSPLMDQKVFPNISFFLAECFGCQSTSTQKVEGSISVSTPNLLETKKTASANVPKFW